MVSRFCGDMFELPAMLAPGLIGISASRTTKQTCGPYCRIRRQCDRQMRQSCHFGNRDGVQATMMEPSGVPKASGQQASRRHGTLGRRAIGWWIYGPSDSSLTFYFFLRQHRSESTSQHRSPIPHLAAKLGWPVLTSLSHHYRFTI
jgi:hypothetical protein